MTPFGAVPRTVLVPRRFPGALCLLVLGARFAARVPCRPLYGAARRFSGRGRPVVPVLLSLRVVQPLL